MKIWNRYETAPRSKGSVDTICSCCGTSVLGRVMKTSDLRRLTYGIKLGSGLIGEEIDNDKWLVKHFKTSAGDFTISFQKQHKNTPEPQ